MANKYVRIINLMTNATDSDVRGPMADFLLQEGVLDIDSHFEVTEKGTPDMSVDVAAGLFHILNDSFSEFSTVLKFWDGLMDAAENTAISSNASGSTRIDLVCIKIDTAASPDADASNVASIVIVEGTPGAGAPALPANHLQLAEVEVINGASSIPNAKITDSRQSAFIDLKKASIASGVQGNILYVNALKRMARLANGTAGKVLTTNGASANPSWETVSSFAWNEETGVSETMLVSNGYIANNAGQVDFTLPATASVGDIIEVVGKGAGGWKISQGAGQTIRFGNQSTTTGAGGSLESTHRRDTVRLLCTTEDDGFTVLSSVGNIDVT